MAKINFTAARVAGFKCPEGKAQAFMWDSDTQGLGVRITPAGKPAYIFQRQHDGSTRRVTIGGCDSWTVVQARDKARELQREIDSGRDPAGVKRAAKAADRAEKLSKAAERAKRETTGLDAWAEYVKEGRKVGFTKRGPWSARHAADHDTMVSAGGAAYKRKSAGVTQPGPLYALLSAPLVDVSSAGIAQWLKDESAIRPARAALAFRLLRGFLNWCGEHPRYRVIASADAHKPKDVRRLIRTQVPKDDVLQREHLTDWFAAVLADGNPYARAYLLALLLTGARKNELSSLSWADTDFRFGGSLTIRDKVEGLRVIPCPAYLTHILAQLPRRGPWVFGPDGTAPNVGHTAAYNHRKALAVGGLPHVSLHGLRRSFGSLAEWVECPAGVVAQLMGHKPSATAEKHYRTRPLDLLRVWHEKIVSWMLEEAGIKFDPKAEAGKLQLVA